MAQENPSIQNEVVAESVNSEKDEISSAIAEASVSAVATAESMSKADPSTVAASSEPGSEITKARSLTDFNLENIISVTFVILVFATTGAIVSQIMGL